MAYSAVQFDQAVRLAAAFVANGDIRIDGSTRRDQDGLDKLQDLIGTLYEVIDRSKELLVMEGPLD